MPTWLLGHLSPLGRQCLPGARRENTPNFMGDGSCTFLALAAVPVLNALLSGARSHQLAGTGEGWGWGGGGDLSDAPGGHIPSREFERALPDRHAPENIRRTLQLHLRQEIGLGLKMRADRGGRIRRTSSAKKGGAHVMGLCKRGPTGCFNVRTARSVRGMTYLDQGISRDITS